MLANFSTPAVSFLSDYAKRDECFSTFTGAAEDALKANLNIKVKARADKCNQKYRIRARIKSALYRLVIPYSFMVKVLHTIVEPDFNVAPSDLNKLLTQCERMLEKELGIQLNTLIKQLVRQIEPLSGYISLNYEAIGGLLTHMLDGNTLNWDKDQLLSNCVKRENESVLCTFDAMQRGYMKDPQVLDPHIVLESRTPITLMTTKSLGGWTFLSPTDVIGRLPITLSCAMPDKYAQKVVVLTTNYCGDWALYPNKQQESPHNYNNFNHALTAREMLARYDLDYVWHSHQNPTHVHGHTYPRMAAKLGTAQGFRFSLKTLCMLRDTLNVSGELAKAEGSQFKHPLDLYLPFQPEDEPVVTLYFVMMATGTPLSQNWHELMQNEDAMNQLMILLKEFTGTPVYLQTLLLINQGVMPLRSDFYSAWINASSITGESLGMFIPADVSTLLPSIQAVYSSFTHDAWVQRQVSYLDGFHVKGDISFVKKDMISVPQPVWGNRFTVSQDVSILHPMIHTLSSSKLRVTSLTLPQSTDFTYSEYELPEDAKILNVPHFTQAEKDHVWPVPQGGPRGRAKLSEILSVLTTNGDIDIKSSLDLGSGRGGMSTEVGAHFKIKVSDRILVTLEDWDTKGEPLFPKEILKKRVKKDSTPVFLQSLGHVSLGDYTSDVVFKHLLSLRKTYDLILDDSGGPSHDEQGSGDSYVKGFQLYYPYLTEEGVYIIKVRSTSCSQFTSILNSMCGSFAHLLICKPSASRPSSDEHYLVGIFKIPVMGRTANITYEAKNLLDSYFITVARDRSRQFLSYSDAKQDKTYLHLLPSKVRGISLSKLMGMAEYILPKTSFRASITKEDLWAIPYAQTLFTWHAFSFPDSNDFLYMDLMEANPLSLAITGLYGCDVPVMPITPAVIACERVLLKQVILPDTVKRNRRNPFFEYHPSRPLNEPGRGTQAIKCSLYSSLTKGKLILDLGSKDNRWAKYSRVSSPDSWYGVDLYPQRVSPEVANFNPIYSGDCIAHGPSREFDICFGFDFLSTCREPLVRVASAIAYYAIKSKEGFYFNLPLAGRIPTLGVLASFGYRMDTEWQEPRHATEFLYDPIELFRLLSTEGVVVSIIEIKPHLLQMHMLRFYGQVLTNDALSAAMELLSVKPVMLATVQR